jgi:nitroreductase
LAVTALSQLLNTHRSIRAFKPTPIANELIESVCSDAIAGGSSSGNLNSVSLILTRDEERKKKLFELHFKQPMILQAPLLITFCADWHRTRTWLAMRGARDNFNNLLGYHVAAFDAMIVAQNACLGFEAHGLGICYMGTTLHSMPEIAELLELPETCAPVTTIVVGYPDENPNKRDRLPLSAFLHEERYRATTPEEIETTYREREVKGWERYMSMPPLKAIIEREGIASLAEFYTSKVKYDPDVFARDSAKLEAFLRAKKLL